MKASAKRLLAHLHDKLVLDWRRKAATTADVRTDDPRRPRRRPARRPVPARGVRRQGPGRLRPRRHRLRRRRLQRLRRRSTSSRRTPAGGVATLAADRTSTPITEEVVERIRDRRRVRVARRRAARPGRRPALRTVEELIDNDEDYAVEFKSTARWDLREDQPSKAMEDAIVKTVAGFLNTDGGTLLIGVGPDRDGRRPRPRLPAGEAARTATASSTGSPPTSSTPSATPPSCAPGPASPSTTATRSAASTSPRSSQPVWAKTSKDDQRLLRPHEQLDPRAARRRRRGVRRRPLACAQRRPMTANAGAQSASPG